MEDSDDTILELLWEKVLDDVHAEEAHDELIQHGATTGRLLDVAKRYRTRRDELPEDDETRTLFDERLAAIAALAIADLEARKPQRREQHPAVTIFMVLIGLVLLASVAGLLRALLL